LLDGYVIDVRDENLAGALDLPVAVAPTLMVTLQDRERVARLVLEFADGLAEGAIDCLSPGLAR
jgi:hypothetical protein